MRISDWSSDVCSSDLRVWSNSGQYVVARPACRQDSPKVSSSWRRSIMYFDTPPVYIARIRTPRERRFVDCRRNSFGSGQSRMTAMSARSEEHTSELQSLMRISYAVFCLKKKNKQDIYNKSTKYTIYHNTYTHI